MIDIDTLGYPAFTLRLDPQDGALRFERLNAVHERLTGLRAGDLAGRTPREALPRALADEVEAHFRRCCDSGLIEEYEEELALPSGRRWFRTTLLPILDPASGRVARVFGLAVDITDRKRAEQDLRQAAFFDPLTGIANRRRFDVDFENALARAIDTGRPFTLILADIDRFKTINDRLGHATGDAVLREVAGRLREGVREGDKVARFGGDEFVALISAATEGAVAVALDRLRRRVPGPVRIGDISLDVGVSLGAALWAPGATTGEMLASADRGMYAEKALRAA